MNSRSERQAQLIVAERWRTHLQRLRELHDTKQVQAATDGLRDGLGP